MAAYLLIALGGALGSVARYGCAQAVAAYTPSPFPWATLLVNILGSFIIGMFSALTGPDGRFVLGDEARLFVMVGLCGGYTTFSAFSLQTLDLMQSGRWTEAGANIVGSVVLCLGAVWLGNVAGIGFSGR